MSTRGVDEDPGRRALVEAREVAVQHGLEQPQLRPCRHDRDRVQQVPCPLPEPRHAREHGVADGVRDRAAGCEHLRHEERIAARLAVQLGPVRPAPGGEHRHGLERERLDGQPDDLARGRELAEQQLERVACAELVVPEAHGDRRGHRVDPAREQAQHVERRLVGAVDVLEHEQRRRLRRELDDERVGELVERRAAPERVGQPAAHAPGDLDERAQRPRRLERHAAAPQDARGARADGNPAQERGLADAGLAPDEREPAGAVRGVRERGVQRLDQVGTLQQLLRHVRDIVQLRTNGVHGTPSTQRYG